MPPIIPQSLRPPARARTITQIRESKVSKPSSPQLVQQSYAPSEEVKKVEFELKDIERNISAEQQRVADLQRRLQDPNISGEKADQLQDNIAMAQADIRGLDKARNALHQGYTVKSAQDIATFESNKQRETMRLQDAAQAAGFANITEYRKAVQQERERIATEKFEATKPVTREIDTTPTQSNLFPQQQDAFFGDQGMSMIPTVSSITPGATGTGGLSPSQFATLQESDKGKFIGYDTSGKEVYSKSKTPEEVATIISEPYSPTTFSERRRERFEDVKGKVESFIGTQDQPSEVFVSGAGRTGMFIEPGGFGTGVSRPPTSEEQATFDRASQLGSFGTAVDVAFETAEKIPGVGKAIEVTTPYVRKGISSTAGLFQTYAEATPITKVVDVLNLPITRNGFDIAKAVGDILNAYKSTKQSEVSAKNSLKVKSEFLASKTEELNQATTEEEIKKIINQIKAKGIKVKEITTEDGQLTYQFDIPIPSALKDGIDAETFAAFFTTAHGIAYGRTGAEVTGVLGGKPADVETSRIVFGKIGEIAPYFYGAGFGTALIAEPFVEKGVYGGKEELKGYVKEHPVETFILGGVLIGGAVGAVKKIKRIRRFNSYQKAKIELKRLQDYHNTIAPVKSTPTVMVAEKHIGKLTKTQIQQLKSLQIQKEVLNKAVRVKYSGGYDLFEKTVPTMQKTSKGFYEVNEFGKVIKFYNNKITMTLFLDDGTSVTLTLLSKSNRPLTTLESFMKYGTNKKVISGVSAGDDFTAITMSSIWGGEAKDPQRFIAKTTKADKAGAITSEVRRTRGIEKYGDDLDDVFGFSSKVGERKVTKPIKGKKEPFGTGDINIKGDKGEVTLFSGTTEPSFSIGKTTPQVEIGDPFLSKLIKEQSKGRELLFAPKKTYTPWDLTDDIILKKTPKPKPKPSPKPTPKDVQEQIFFPSQETIKAQEAATQTFSITDVTTKAPKFTPKGFEGVSFGGKFEGIELGAGTAGGLGVLDTKFDTIKEDRVSAIGEFKIKTDTKTKLELDSGMDLRLKDDLRIGSGLLTGQESLVDTDVRTKIKQDTLITPAITTAQKTAQQLKTQQVQDTGFPGVPSTPYQGDFRFPGETGKIRSPVDIDRGKKPRKAERTGYHTFVKSKGKYQKVTDKPHTRMGAMDVGSRIVDNTLSADFKISPIKQKKIVKGKQKAVLKQFEEDELSKGDRYFRTAANKFRQFMVRKGSKIQMQDRWIEKKGRRLDTSGEQRGITVANFMARQTKRSMGLPVRRKKSQRKKPFRL